jgi:hypothetical protein
VLSGNVADKQHGLLEHHDNHCGLLRIEAIIDPFLCLLKESVFGFGFRCESINCSSHNESPKLPGFGVFNSSSCAPVKSGGTSLYSKSDSVHRDTRALSSIGILSGPVFNAAPEQKTRGARPKPLHLHLANRHQVHFTRVV